MGQMGYSGVKDDKNSSSLVSATYIGDKGPENSPPARYCFIFAQRVKFTLSLTAPLSAHTASIGYTISLRRMMRISRAINEEEFERDLLNSYSKLHALYHALGGFG